MEKAQQKNDDIRGQHKILNESVKKLNEDLRAVDNKLTDVKSS